MTQLNLPSALAKAIEELETKAHTLRCVWEASLDALSASEDNFFRQRTWSIVVEMLNLHCNAVQGGYSDCSALTLCAWHFSDVVSAVEHKTQKGRLFDDRLREWVTTTVETRVNKPLLANFNDEALADQASLFEDVRATRDHIKASLSFAEVLFKDRPSLDSLRELFLKTFNTVVHDRLKSRFVSALIQEVTALREGTKSEDFTALQDYWRSYVEVGTNCAVPCSQSTLFTENVEGPYLAALQESYQRSALPVDRVDFSKYLSWADERVAFEFNVITNVFSVPCQEAVNALAAVVVTPYCFEILNHPEFGVAALLNAGNDAVLAQMYSLMKRVNDLRSVRSMCDVFGHHIRLTFLPMSGSQLTWAALSSVLAARDKYNVLIRETFDNDAMFLNASKNAFTAVLLSTYAHYTNLARADHDSAAMRNMVAELLLACENATVVFKTQYCAAFTVFYQAPGVSKLLKDLPWVQSRIEFELSVLPSRGTALHRLLHSWVLSRFARSVANIAVANSASLLQAWNQDELKRLYQLAKRVEDPYEAALHAMGEALQASIVEASAKLLRDLEAVAREGPRGKARAAVLSIVKLNNKYRKLIAECFDCDALLVECCTQGFNHALHAPQKLEATRHPVTGEKHATLLEAAIKQYVEELSSARADAAYGQAATLQPVAYLIFELPLSTDAFEVEYRKAFMAFYQSAGAFELQYDLNWLASQLDFELAVLPSRASPLEGTLVSSVLSHFARSVANIAVANSASLLQAWNQDELKRLYMLAKRVEDPSEAALHAMGEALQASIVEASAELLRDWEAAAGEGALGKARAAVLSILELNTKYSKLIVTSFENYAPFLKYRKLGFTEVLKAPLKRNDGMATAAGNGSAHHATSFSEVLATFLDAVMRRELHADLEHDALTVLLDDLLTLFMYITDKDVFQEFYRVKLAKRLLLTTPNEDLEKGFLERLQREMGKNFTRRMEGMVLDCDSSCALSEKFAQDSACSAGLCVEFEVRVLTAANWPAYNGDNLRPPLSLQRCVDAFTRFYKKSHPTRHLTWINTLGSASLTMLFPKGTKDVTATLHQASVLVLVDEAGQLSVRALAEALGLDAQAVKPHVASMYLSKFPLLQRTNATTASTPVNTIGDDDRFALNPEFKHSTRKFRLPAAVVKGVEASVGPTAIDDQRKLQINCAVVRIMKSRKKLSYTELQHTTINTLGKYFTVQPKLLKACLDELIDREYLQRHGDDPTLLEYLA